MTAPEVSLRRLRPDDERPFLDAVRRSRRLHHPWVHPPDTSEAFLGYVAESATRVTLVAVTREDELAGTFALSQIYRGPFLNAYLGFYAFAPHAGTGVMRAGMPLLFRFAFGELGLHRLQANVQPANDRSIALLRATGWREEGYARRYLKIGGRWRDHLMFAILAEDARATSRRAT